MCCTFLNDANVKNVNTRSSRAEMWGEGKAGACGQRGFGHQMWMLRPQGGSSSRCTRLRKRKLKMLWTWNLLESHESLWILGRWIKLQIQFSASCIHPLTVARQIYCNKLNNLTGVFSIILFCQTNIIGCVITALESIVC